MSSARRVRPKAWGARALLPSPQCAHLSPPRAIRGIIPTTANATGASNQRLAEDSAASPSGGDATHWLQVLASSAPRLSWTGPVATSPGSKSADDTDRVATSDLSELGTAPDSNDEHLSISAPAAATRSCLEPSVGDMEHAGKDSKTETAQCTRVRSHSPCAISQPAAALRRSVSDPDTLGVPHESSRLDGHAAQQSDAAATSANGAHHNVASTNGGVCSTSENTAVRGGLGEYLQRVCGLEHAETEEGGERDDVPSLEGREVDAEQRIRSLARIVRFQEWEAKCMRQDIKVALNTSLWNSVTAPSLHAIVEHVRARRNATQESLEWRRRFRSIQCCFAAWHDEMRRNRLHCRSRAGAERIRARLDRLLQCTSFWDWAALCASRAPPSSSSRQAFAAHASSPGKSGCFGGLVRCLGGARREQKATFRDKTDVESDGHRQTAAV